MGDKLCRRHRLPSPRVNARVGSLTVDRARDLRVRALGYEVIRLSHKQVLEEPERVAGVLKVALQAAP